MKVLTTLVISLLIFQAQLVLAVDDLNDEFRGTWETAPYLSQLGRVITKYTFKENGGCAVSMRFLDAKIREFEEVGSCRFEDGKLTLKNRNGLFVNTYVFSNDVLTITEKNGDSYNLKRE